MARNDYVYYKREFLNKEGYHSSAHIIAEVFKDEEESYDRGRPYHIGECELTLADCSRSVSFDFSLWTEDDIENTLEKARFLRNTINEFVDHVERQAEKAKEWFENKDEEKDLIEKHKHSIGDLAYKLDLSPNDLKEYIERKIKEREDNDARDSN